MECLQDARRKLKVHGRLLRRFSQQIKNLTKLIKNWSIQRNEGKAWIFFIFAVCDWLPLNHQSTNMASMISRRHSAIYVKETQLRQQNIYFPVEPLEKNKMQSENT